MIFPAALRFIRSLVIGTIFIFRFRAVTLPAWEFVIIVLIKFSGPRYRLLKKRNI